MPKSKNKRVRKKIKPRSFATVKSARRWLNRFSKRLLMYHRYDKAMQETVMEAVELIRRRAA